MDSHGEALLDLVDARRGHFLLESGHHGGLWLDLDPLFVDVRRIRPLVDAFSATLRPYAVDAVCGPLLGGAFLAQLVASALDVEFLFTEREIPLGSTGLYQARYRLRPALAARAKGRRVAIVDDVMSAGSALRGTYEALTLHGAHPIAAGALLVLGTVGASYFAERGVPVEALARETYELWPPEGCPLCAAKIPVESFR